MSSILSNFDFKGLLQIMILTGVIYYIFSFFRGTRSAQMLFGIIIFLSGFWAIAFFLRLEVLLFIVSKLTVALFYAAIVIFQPEIRQAFHALGHQRLSVTNDAAKSTLIATICSAAETLSMRKYGALIVIERDSHLLEFVKTGTALNAPVVLQLLTSIFYPNTPLHDGAVIIKGETILAARCVLPLSQTDISRGTRHRAALGLSEQTDAVVVVVSEETGTISIACAGRIISDLNKRSLASYLSRLIHNKESFSEIMKRSFSEFNEHGIAGVVSLSQKADGKSEKEAGA